MKRTIELEVEDIDAQAWETAATRHRLSLEEFIVLAVRYLLHEVVKTEAPPKTPPR